MQALPGSGREQAVEYVFDNRYELAQMRYRDLSALYDGQTIRHIEQCAIEEGWSCLEVGGGGGSIAAWMCNRVGPNGRVLATDIEPGFLERLAYANLEVRRHDIRYEGLPTQEFDLAHARLVLMHLLGSEVALQRMIGSLKPGGWLLVEEFDGLSVLPNLTPDSDSVVQEPRLSRALRQVLIARGVDMGYGRSLPQRLRVQGLVNIGAEASMSLWNGHSAGKSLFKLNFEEMADAILRAGLMTEAEFEADLKRVDDSDFVMPSPLMWSVWGQVPELSSRTDTGVAVFEHRQVAA